MNKNKQKKETWVKCYANEDNVKYFPFLWEYKKITVENNDSNSKSKNNSDINNESLLSSEIHNGIK